MSLKIRIPRAGAAGPSQVEEASAPRRKTKRRQPVLSSDDEDDDAGGAPAHAAPQTKRARTAEAEEPSGDIDVEGDEEVTVDDDGPAQVVDTRFLPPEASARTAPAKRAAAKKAKPAPRRPKKRAVVLSDEDGGGEDGGGSPDVVVDDDDDDFTPEPAAPRRAGSARAKVKTWKAAAAAAEKVEKKITVKDERRAVSSREGSAAVAKRGTPGADPDYDDDAPAKADAVEPPPKKRKLPPIKKTKPSTGTSTPTAAASKPAPKPGEASGLESIIPPVVGRKTAAVVNNADFDLRDKSVYASLFMKPGGSTPNSGLSRKEKEEEKRRELNRMREEARAKRQAEAKNSFDLQSQQEKIIRFERKLVERIGKTSATYPNILGGIMKDNWERAKVAGREPQRPFP